MRFAASHYLWLLLALPLIGLLGFWAAAARRRALGRFAGGAEAAARFAASVCPHRRAVKLILLYFALAALVVAAARPQWGSRLEPVTRKGIDVVIVVDRSLSMAAEDLAPNRLGHALHAVDNLVDSLPGDRIALVTFAGSSALACPLTLDHGAVRLYLDAVEVEAEQVPGTALAEALAKALGAVGGPADTDDGERSAVIVLFSDGEDHEGELDEIQRQLRRQGVPVFAVGCGTAAGAPIPLRGTGGMLNEYKKDREDRVVTTRLEEQVLEDLALATEGRYFRATASELEIDEISGAIRGMDAREFGSVLRAKYEERFQLPLALALLALFAETMMGDRRRGGGPNGRGPGRAA